MNYNQNEYEYQSEVKRTRVQVDTNKNVTGTKTILVTDISHTSPKKKMFAAPYIGAHVLNKRLKEKDMTLSNRRTAKMQRLHKYEAETQSALGGVESLSPETLVETTYEWETMCDDEETLDDKITDGCSSINCSVQSGFGKLLFGNDAMAKLAKSTDVFTDKVKDIDVNTLNEFLDRLNQSGMLEPEFTNKVYNGLTSIQEFKEYVTSFKETNYQATFNSSVDAILLVSIIYGAYKIYKTGEKQYIAITLACTAWLAVEHGPSMLELAKQFITESVQPIQKQEDVPDLDMDPLETPVEPQRGDFGVRDFGKIVSIILSTYTSCVSGKSVPAELFKNLGSVDRVTNSIESIIGYIVEALEVSYNWVLQNFYDRGTYQRFLTQKFGDFENIIKRADELDCMIRQGTFVPNVDNLDRVAVLVYMINVTLRTLPRNAETTNLCSELLSLKTKYTKIMDDNCAAAQIGGNLRPEPVLVMLQGLPGVRKTVLAQQMAADLIYSDATEVERKEIKSNPSAYMFYRRPGEPFWETYTPHHKAVVIDDFGQTTDMAGGETSEFLDIIHMINSAPFPLRMAEIADKGKRFFTAKYVIATTNVNDIRPVSIVSADAVKRRVHFLAQVKPKPQYCKPSTAIFDSDKLPTVQIDGHEETTIDLNMVTFDIVDWTGSVIEEGLEYSTFRRRILELREKHDRYYKVLRHNIQQVMKDQDSCDIEAQSGMRKYPVGNITNPMALPKMDIHPEDMEAALDFLDKIDQSSDKEKLTVALKRLSGAAGIHFSHEFDYKVAVLVSRYGSLLELLLDSDNEFNSTNFRTILNDMVRGRIEPLPLRQTDSYSAAALKSCFELLCTATISLAFKAASGLTDLCNTFKKANNVKYIIVVVVAASPFIIDLIYKGFKGVLDTLFGTNLDLYRATGQSAEKSIPKVKLERNLSKIKTRFIKTVPQLGNDPNGVDMMTSTMNRNCYEVLIPGAEEGKDMHVGYCIFVVASVALMPYHFITHMAAMLDDEIIELDTLVIFRRRTKERPVVYEVKVSDLFAGSEKSVLETNDLVLVQMPRTFQMHRDIVSNFVTDKTIGRMRNTIDISMLCPSFDRLTEVQTHAKFVDNKRINDVDGTQYTVRQSFVYAGVNTKKGDCGSVVAYLNPSIPKEKILGLHIAGNTTSGIGFCGVASQEMIREALEAFKYDTVETEIAECQSDMYFDSGQFTFVSKVDRTPRIPTKTMLTKSKMYGVYDDLFVPNESPAPIHLVRKPEVTKKMFGKYWVKTVKRIDYTKEVESTLSWLYSASHTDVEKRVYTFEEACEGIQGSRFSSLDRGTSSGYPYNLDPRTAKKSYFFGNHERFDFGRPQAKELRDRVQVYIKACENGHRIPQLYSDFPKDELRSRKKVESEDIRAIAGCSMTLLVAMRQYFGAFAHWLVCNNVVNGSTIGTDPRSDEWHILATKLLEKNEYVNAGDYKAYDGSLTPSLLWAVLDLINEWYNDGNSETRRMMWYEIVNSRHIFDGFVFEWLGSMPSGNPLTATINTIGNHILVRKCWNDMDIEDDFNECVYLVVNGDDNAFSVIPIYADMFNEFTIIPYLDAQGMTYTTETKVQTLSHVRRRITDIEYLKRSFVYNKELNRWMGPLRQTKVLEMPYWTRKDDDDITKDKVEDCLVELAYAGKKDFDLYGVRMVEEYRTIFGNSKGWFRTTSYSKILERAL